MGPRGMHIPTKDPNSYFQGSVSTGNLGQNTSQNMQPKKMYPASTGNFNKQMPNYQQPQMNNSKTPPPPPPSGPPPSFTSSSPQTIKDKKRKKGKNRNHHSKSHKERPNSNGFYPNKSPKSPNSYNVPISQSMTGLNGNNPINKPLPSIHNQPNSNGYNPNPNGFDMNPNAFDPRKAYQI